MKEVRSSWENVDGQRGFHVELTGLSSSEQKRRDGVGGSAPALSAAHVSPTWSQVTHGTSEACALGLLVCMAPSRAHYLILES